MKRVTLILVLSLLSALLINAYFDLKCIPEDPLTYDSRLEVVQLYNDQWPTGIAINSYGRRFSCYSASLDAQNTNDGCNGKYQVAEITSGREVPYPNFVMNNPPGGVIDYSTNPPTAKGLTDYFIGVQTVYCANEYLYCLDTGRALDQRQVLYEASPGGSKLVVINTGSNCVVRSYGFPTSVATPRSYLTDMAIDTVINKAYISDGLLYQLIVLDLKSGCSYVAFAGDQSLMSPPGSLPYVWGQPQYELQSNLYGYGNSIEVDSIRFGVAGLALSPDNTKLYFCQVGVRKLYSVPTAALLAPGTPSSVVAQTVEDHGEKGVSFGLTCDQNGIVWSGNCEANGISSYNPNCQFAKLRLYIRDKRISWAYQFSNPGDGYIYFIQNAFNGLPAFYTGTGPFYADRRRRPYILFRFRMPSDCLCPNTCDPATLGLQVPSGCPQ